MKNLKVKSAILVIALFLGSCAKNPAEMIIGEWKITDIETTAEITEDQLDTYNEYIENIKATTSLTLNIDNTCIKKEDGEETTGKWKMSDDAKTLTLTYEGGSDEVSNIIELTDTKLSISLEVNDSKNTITYEKTISK